MQVEQQWAEEEEEHEMGDADRREQFTIPEDQMADASGPDSEIDSGYVQMFIMRYLCPQEDCGGTLAPILGSDVQECNRCSHKRTNAEFMALVQSLQDDDEFD